MIDNELMKGKFLAQRMVELREKNGKTQSEMAADLFVNKSTLSRVENGESGYKTILKFANDYCNSLGLTDEQTKQFLRGNRAIVTDTSALLKYPQLIDELRTEYSKVIVPKVVIDELDYRKDHNINNLGPRAWQILRSISGKENVITRECLNKELASNNDDQIIQIAKDASEEFHCSVDIITYDTGFAARLNGNDTVHALFLEEYIRTKQNLLDIGSIKKINDYYANTYDSIEKELGIRIPNEEDINAYLQDGNTLIISVVRNKKMPLNQRKEKIKWLIAKGADVNRRDNGRYNLPPISHAIQKNDFEIFKFLLHECQADPNIGSRNPYDVGKIRQKNDGNMPLMIAAWDNKIDFVKELLADERTSINQQDGNGFTALTKAWGNGFIKCKEILIAAGADTKIIDRDGYTAEKRYEEYLETGLRMNKKYEEKSFKNGGFRK